MGRNSWEEDHGQLTFVHGGAQNQDGAKKGSKTTMSSLVDVLVGMI